MAARSESRHRFCGHVQRIIPSSVFSLGRRADSSAPPPRPPQCGTIDSGAYVNLTERNLQDAQKFLLMHEVVQPVDPVPYFMEDSVRFTHVAVDVVQGKDVLFHIIFLATGTSSPPCIVGAFVQENALKLSRLLLEYSQRYCILGRVIINMQPISLTETHFPLRKQNSHWKKKQFDRFVALK